MLQYSYKKRNIMPKIDYTAKAYQWCFDTAAAYRPERGSKWYHLGQNLAARVKYPAIALAAVVEAVACAVAAALVALSLIIPYLAWRERAELAGDLAKRAIIYSPLAVGIGVIGALSPGAASKCIGGLAKRLWQPAQNDDFRREKSATHYSEREKANISVNKLKSQMNDFHNNLTPLSQIDTKDYAHKLQLLISDPPPALLFTDQERALMQNWQTISKSCVSNWTQLANPSARGKNRSIGSAVLQPATILRRIAEAAKEKEEEEALQQFIFNNKDLLYAHYRPVSRRNNKTDFIPYYGQLRQLLKLAEQAAQSMDEVEDIKLLRLRALNFVFCSGAAGDSNKLSDLSGFLTYLNAQEST